MSDNTSNIIFLGTLSQYPHYVSYDCLRTPTQPLSKLNEMHTSMLNMKTRHCFVLVILFAHRYVHAV